MTATFCRGTVTLRARGLLLGRSSFGIAGGAARKVRIALTRAGLALLAREGVLVATVAATARDVQGDRRTTRATVTVLA